MDDALRAARRAVDIDKLDAAAHVWVGVLSLFTKNFDAALAATDRAVELSPNNAMARTFRSLVCGWTGRPEEGVEECRLALRLSPRDWCRFLFLHNLACCHYVARDSSAAIEAATKIVALKPDYLYGYQLLAMPCAQLGQTERASAAFREAVRLNSNFDLASVKRTASYMDPADMDHELEGLGRRVDQAGGGLPGGAHVRLASLSRQVIPRSRIGWRTGYRCLTRTAAATAKRRRQPTTARPGR